ncbi:MAG: nucleotidyltransferase domain-containing protein [Candidatus Omnitrophica bacterium]|nr:nucleotidyltransferase domain-containing protein [Candidatus Omnitrophota bacterium]
MKLQPQVEATVRDFVGKLKGIYGENLVSVILYGSAASGEFTDRYSNINLMIILKDSSLLSIAKAHRLVKSRSFRLISPVFFTENEILSSLDVFPIEYLDIIENHVILFGKDITNGLKVETGNLRFQCEQELRSKIINIKKQYLMISGKKDTERLLFKSFNSSLHILRNLLRLKGVKPPYHKAEILAGIESYFHVNTKVFNEILWARNKAMALTHKEADALLAGLVNELECICNVIDKI